MSSFIVLAQFFFIVSLLFLTAIAFFPSIVKEKKARAALPLIGITFFAFISYTRSFFELNQTTFQLIIFITALIGSIRLYKTLSHDFTFNKERLINGLNSTLIVVLLCSPIALKLMLSSFDINDEIYSWNYWAQQIVNLEDIDFYFTQAPYPQFFSHFIASVYLILGSLELQSTAKLTLVILPISFICLLISSYTKSINWWCILFIFVLLFGTKLHKEFSMGLADPLMATLLATGIYFLMSVNKFKHLSSLSTLLISTVLITASMLTKQAALPWAIMLIPLITIFLSKDIQLAKPVVYLIVVLPIFSGVLWVLTVGNGFMQNDGVVSASMGDRDYLNQLKFSVINNLKDYPVFMLSIVILFFTLLKKQNLATNVALLGCFISFVLWLLFGSYDLRLGMHVLLILLAVSAASFIPTKGHSRFIEKGLTTKAQIITTFVLIGLTALVSADEYKDVRYTYDSIKGQPDFLKGSTLQSNKLFHTNSFTIIDDIKRSNSTVWTGSNYIYGIMYSISNAMKPELSINKNFDLISYIDKNEIDYFMLSSSRLSFGSLNQFMRTQLEKCSNKFSKTSITESYVGLTVYKVNQSINNCSE